MGFRAQGLRLRVENTGIFYVGIIRDYIGTIFPHSLRSASKISGSKLGVEDSVFRMRGSWFRA